MIQSLLFDTTAIVELIHKNQAAIDLKERVLRPFTSIVVVGELYFGAEKSKYHEKTLRQTTDTLSRFEVIEVDDKIARAYAKIRAYLKSKGTPIPHNDIWIAATAYAYGFPVASFDGHFDGIKMIKVVR